VQNFDSSRNGVKYFDHTKDPPGIFVSTQDKKVWWRWERIFRKELDGKNSSNLLKVTSFESSLILHTRNMFQGQTHFLIGSNQNISPKKMAAFDTSHM
jgi:hypothetical protein